MNPEQHLLSRRNLLRGTFATAALALFAPGVFADHLEATPPLTEGPFYPRHLPLDTDNDLIVVGNSTTPAVGEISHVGGRILDTAGDPITDAQVEIWQCDAKGSYIASPSNDPDRNFQGYGRFLTGSTGEYRFRTIKPVPYPGRPAPHIHVKVSKAGRELLITQIFIAGHHGNQRDGVFRGIHDPVERELSCADFKPIKDSKIGELAARFDVVLGRTPADRHEH